MQNKVITGLILMATISLAGCETVQPTSTLRFDYKITKRAETGLIRAFEHENKTVLQFMDIKKSVPKISDKDGKQIKYTIIGQYAVLPSVYKVLTVTVNGVSSQVKLNEASQINRDVTVANKNSHEQSYFAKTKAKFEKTKADLSQLKAGNNKQKSLFERKISQIKNEANVVKQESNPVSMQIRFAFGGTQFQAADEIKNQLLKNAQVAKGINLRGRTDSRFADYMNNTVALRRAVAVKQFLVRNGIDAKKIYVYSAGAGHFIADNSTDVGKAENRRVDVEFFD